ncbi:MAG: helix-turn-helix transcriptional regulator [Oscillospiraceae bacterium]|nr:helix-turn-helix transcriptional regulator [Oscillospiraceae bacterium]
MNHMSRRNSTYILFSFLRLSSILNKVVNTMNLDYSEIGRRIASRRKALGLKQVQVCEIAGISDKYLSAIERAVSIPSLEVLMRLAIALDTTPDEFLVGTVQNENEAWKEVAEKLRGMDAKQLSLAKSLLSWLREQSL